ncbi:MAG: uroporphyrinogen decarboxylase family protein [Candidatus Hydrogenedentes bacterium]|nr:uroporphyrinogen decarboxylase family protein [Candidatus Hydrogenedentota bacterium]
MGFPGIGMIGTSIKVAQQNHGMHFRAVRALAERYRPDLIFPLMDLSVEANALGRYTVFPRDDSATVPKQPFSDGELDVLRGIDIASDSRVMGYVETVRRMRSLLPQDMLVGAYVAGPYSLAGLILGADDAAMASLGAPDEMDVLCDFTRETITTYVRQLIGAGAQVLCVLEPSAVMLGPEQFERFSASHVRKIAGLCRGACVSSIYHTCGNTMHVVDIMAAAGVDGISLDAAHTGVDLPAVAQRVSRDIAVIGNICPATTMLYGSTAEVRRSVEELLDEMDPYPNFILSTGCDLPAETPPENIEAFMETGRRHAHTSDRSDPSDPSD